MQNHPRRQIPLINGDLLLLAAVSAIAFLTVVGHDPASSLSFRYGTYLMPAVLGGLAVLLVRWRPVSVLPIALGVGTLHYLRVDSSLIFLAGGFLLLILTGATACRQADRAARRGALLIVALAVVTLVAGLAFTGTHDTGGEPQAIVYAAAIGVCASLLRPRMTILLANVVTLGCLASYYAVTSSELRIDRTYAILGQNANGIGLLAALGFVSAAVLLRRPGFWSRFGSLTACVLCMAGIVSSGSRGALLAAACGLATLVMHRALSGRGWRAPVTLAVLGGIAYALASPAFRLLEQMSGRQIQDSSSDLQIRASALSFALRQGFEHPIFGVGLGRLPGISLQQANSGIAISAHNVFAGVFAECGGVALALLVAVCAVALNRSRRYAPVHAFPLVVVVVVSGVSVSWYGSGLVADVVMLIVGGTISLRTDRPAAARHTPGSSATEAFAPG